MNAAPTLEMIDPTTLTVDINVRKDAALTAEFVASIKEHGVMEPVIAHRKDDGTVHVLMGQRRTLAAVKAGRDSIPPVMIIESPEEAERIVSQMVENIHRAAMTQGGRSGRLPPAVSSGISAAEIATRTKRPKPAVEGALKAKASAAGTAALGKGHTIEEALVMAEFEGDEEATAELESVVADEPDQLLHVAQQLRDARAHAAALAAFTAELEATETTIVEKPSYHDDETARVSSLKRADGEHATEEDANAVYIEQDYKGECSTVPVIVGWKKLGFKDRYSFSSSAQTGPMTEEQKAERKTLIANNKAMESATTVRRESSKPC